MIAVLKPRHGTALAVAVALAAPVGGQSPEFRSDDLQMPAIHRAQGHPASSDTIELALAPRTEGGSRLEYKVHMQAGDALFYRLESSHPVVSEFHGESDANRAVMFYREDTATAQSHGQFVAPMTGVHGWYLANRNDEPVTIRLTISGYYTLEPGLIPIAKPAP